MEVLHRTSKWGEVRRLACPLRRFPFAAPPNCGGKVVAPATKGGLHFLARQGGCMVLDAKGGIKNGARKGAHLASAAILYTSRGRSPQPACKAKPITGRTLGAQGRKARRRHQPSRRSRVNLREYWKAPPGSRSRSRPRHRRFTSQAPNPSPFIQRKKDIL